MWEKGEGDEAPLCKTEIKSNVLEECNVDETATRERLRIDENRGEMIDREEEEGGGSSLESEGPVPEAKTETPISDGNGISFDNQSEIFRAIEVVERDSLAIFSLRFPPFGPLRIHLHLTPSHAVLHRCHRSPSGICYYKRRVKNGDEYKPRLA
ncbi:hypothetical protein JHK85_020621 [Glycine max]|nr:hypothetical protein JHK85_020621 [Glycine max]KAG5024268.1 hypothetical protein JHK86_020182 [Glycine max]